MECEELSAEENVVFAKRVAKRKEKRSEGDSSDRDNRSARRKKKPAPDTSDEEFAKPMPQTKKTVTTHSEPEQLSRLKSYKRFAHLCNSLSAQKVNDENLQIIKDSVSGMYQMLERLYNENANLRKSQNENTTLDDKLKLLENAIKGATESIRELKTESWKPTSYADKLKAPAASKPAAQTLTTVRHVVAVYPKVGSSMKSSEATKETLVTNLAPAKEKLQIRGVKKIANNGVLVETATKEDMKRVLKNEKLQAAGLVTGLPAKKKPKIIVYDVPNDITEKEFLSSLRQQNLNNAKSSDEVKISHKTGNRSAETSNNVLEVPPGIRETLLNQDRAYIGWRSLKVRDYLTVSRCYKCQSFGHVSKYCKAAKETCGHCGSDGHAFNSCPNKSTNPVCINCKRAAKPCDHSTRSADCPAYKFALSNLISKIDYGK